MNSPSWPGKLPVGYVRIARPTDQADTRLATLGHLLVEAENPCWTERGAVAIEDPGHWRVVLMPRPLT